MNSLSSQQQVLSYTNFLMCIYLKTDYTVQVVPSSFSHKSHCEPQDDHCVQYHNTHKISIQLSTIFQNETFPPSIFQIYSPSTPQNLTEPLRPLTKTMLSYS